MRKRAAPARASSGRRGATSIERSGARTRSREVEMHVDLALRPSSHIPVLCHVCRIDEMPYRRMKVPGMGIEVGGAAKLQVDHRGIGGGFCHVARLVQVVTVVIDPELRSNQVEHGGRDLLAIDPLFVKHIGAGAEGLDVSTIGLLFGNIACHRPTSVCRFFNMASPPSAGCAVGVAT